MEREREWDKDPYVYGRVQSNLQRTKAIFYLFIFLPFGRFYVCVFPFGGNNSIYVLHDMYNGYENATAAAATAAASSTSPTSNNIHFVWLNVIQSTQDLESELWKERERARARVCV